MTSRRTLGWYLLPLLFSAIACACQSELKSAGNPSVMPVPPSNGAVTAYAPTAVHLQLDAPAFGPERIALTVYLPPAYASVSTEQRRYPVLYANDGQDMPAVGLVSTLARLYRERAIEPIIVVAIDMPKDRMGAYGLSDRATARSLVGGSRYGDVGARAQDYSAWVVEQLVPYIDMHYRTQASAHGRAVLGWSLGALNAFNLAWQYPDVFGRLGAFSPSLWLAADRSSPNSIERTRLAQRMIDQAGSDHRDQHADLKMWFAVGTAEETSDRNHDGVIDAVEDVEDLLSDYRATDGFHTRGLKQLGYSINMDYARHPSNKTDVALYLLKDGQHKQASWARMLSPFLGWAYGRH